jgi:hypothetical protein
VPEQVVIAGLDLPPAASTVPVSVSEHSY